MRMKNRGHVHASLPRVNVAKQTASCRSLSALVRASNGISSMLTSTSGREAALDLLHAMPLGKEKSTATEKSLATNDRSSL
eukprot:1016341-Amphidinium_carterae.1